MDQPGRIRMTTWLGAAFALALICAPERASWADDDDSARRETLAKIEAELVGARYVR
jgi:hypothetical protein